MNASNSVARKRWRVVARAGWFVGSVLFAAGIGLLIAAVAAPAACADVGLVVARAGNDVGRNLGGLLRGWGSQVYGGIVAIVSLIFLVNRRYTELAMFLFAAVLVAWMVFSPDQISRAARGIGQTILG